ncbi:unnamed protein product [Nyctereutes procyonoides]|uniref:(raccoon dog) hypothetical protein n=1 Tax=Nyctereutes procyonoides TaxID=34880 RepID=A0A811YDG9_NYCPR|nr:unnamed protein product [Nyctereutes procyonoides]
MSFPPPSYTQYGASLIGYESDHGYYKVVDLTDGHSSGSVVERYPVATQIVVSGVTGWFSAVGHGLLLHIIQSQWWCADQLEAMDLIKQSIVKSSGIAGGYLLDLHLKDMNVLS